MPMEVSAGAVVYRQNNWIKRTLLKRPNVEYLLLHAKTTADEFWSFPKGHMEQDETPEQTAVREVKEETNLDVELKTGFNEEKKWFFKSKGKTIFKKAIFFVAKAKKGQAKVSHEHLECEWLSYENALKRLKFKNDKELLEKAAEFLRQNP